MTVGVWMSDNCITLFKWAGIKNALLMSLSCIFEQHWHIQHMGTQRSPTPASTSQRHKCLQAHCIPPRKAQVPWTQEYLKSWQQLHHHLHCQSLLALPPAPKGKRAKGKSNSVLTNDTMSWSSLAKNGSQS